MASDSPKTCTVRRNVMVDAHVTITPDSYVGRWARTPEERMKALQAWVKEFSEFLRDHRSQDANILDVEPDYKDFCSACGKEYEEARYADTEDGEPTPECPAMLKGCAWCGALVVEEVASVR